MSKKGRIFNLPFGARIAVVSDMHGTATRAKNVTGENYFESELSAKVLRGAKYDENGIYIEGSGTEVPVHEFFGPRDNSLKSKLQRLFYRLYYRNQTSVSLGSGLTTNVFSQALANDWNLAAPSGAAINTFKLAKWHASGTGTTAAAATDVALQTASTQGGQTPQAGTQVLVTAANVQKYQTVATISYTGTEAVTEWVLITASTLSTTTGTPLTASSSTTATVTGTPLTASSSTVQGQQQNILVDTTASPNVYGLVTGNTTSVATVSAWYKVTDGTAGTTPGSTDAIKWLPICVDHKVFSAINVVTGDSIQFTYTLTVNSGG